MKKLKVFALNDYEWWAGYDLKSVKKTYLKEMMMTEDEAFDDPRELTEEEMSKFTIKIIKEEELTYAKAGKYTFAEFLELMIKNKEKFPCMFASTEY